MSNKRLLQEYNELLDNSSDSMNSELSKITWSKLRIFKNLLLVCFSATIFNTALTGIALLQSTINRERGTGVASLAIMNGVAFVTTIFLPKVVISRLGCKTTLAVSFLTYGPYIAYNFYPHWSTLVPASIAAGFANTFLWPTLTTYINRLSRTYSDQSGENHKSVNSLFFGIFGSMHMTTGIWGNLVSFYVLKPPKEHMVPASNTSSVCGINYCESESGVNSSQNLFQPDSNQRYILTGIYLGLVLLAVILIVSLLDSLVAQDRPRISVCQDLKATIRVMVKTDQLLLVPLVMYTGLTYGFYAADVTKAYIACSWGIYQVGLVTISSAIFSVVSVMFCSWLAKCTAQPVAFFTAGAVNIAAFTVWLTWEPREDQYYMLFIMSGLYGSYYPVLWTQLKSLYGVLFKDEEEAGYANDCLWNDVGQVIIFVVSGYICIDTTLHILIVVFCIGFIGYSITEYRHRHSTIKS